MIVIFHNNSRVVSVAKDGKEKIPFSKTKPISFTLMEFATQYPSKRIVWCHIDAKQNLNLNSIHSLMHHDKLMLSYTPNKTKYLGDIIGYLEQSPFINVNNKVTYPTWQMSSYVGAIHASTLLNFKIKISLDSNFDYFLNSIAKIGMPLGLLCYSEPTLITRNIKRVSSKASIFSLFKFVKQHYKTRWVFLLFLNLMLYEKRFPFFALVYGLCFKNRKKSKIVLKHIDLKVKETISKTATIDVIIPTIGRKAYLLDVLKDLSVQTHLPKNVIIVEQNGIEGSVSELDYLKSESWPFIIKHTFTHQLGACNARNVALSQVESEWVFMADDDIRINNDFINLVLNFVSTNRDSAFTLACYRKNEFPIFYEIIQWDTFGSGCSVVKASALKGINFDESFEFGFGEDADFGMQLRNIGVDVLYLPEPRILHLKAPMGGFRTKFAHPWENELILPKPSPTIMYFRKKYHTDKQLKGYKTLLFIKYYFEQNIKNPFRYIFQMNKQWEVSKYWANKL